MPSCRQAAVLVVAHDAAMGGAQLALLESIMAMAAEKYRPIVVVPTPGPFVDALHTQGIPCYWGMAQRWIFFRKPAGGWLQHPTLWAWLSLLTLPLRIMVLFALAKLQRVELVYSNTATVIDGALVAALLNVPHIWHLHETVANNPNLATPWPANWLSAFILDRSDRVIVNSDFLRHSMFNGMPHNKIFTIFNGVDVDRFRDPDPADLRPLVPAAARITAIAGNLGPPKRIEDYIHAVAILIKTHGDTHHLIIGKGERHYIDRLRTLARNLGVAGKIHFIGSRGDMPALLARVDVLVSTSAVETFGRTLIEAMAASIPVVATRSGGPDEIIIDGMTGFLVEVGDVTGIANRMRDLLDDNALTATLGAAGRQRAMTHFSLERVSQQIVESIDAVLTRAS